MNKTILIGRIANELELRYTKNDTAVCNFALAVQRDFDKDTADFIDVTAWKKQLKT